MRLSRSIVYVKDFPLMEAFYGVALGLKRIEGTRSDAWVEFEAGGITLALHAIPPHIAAGIEITSPPQPREETPIKLVFETDDAVALCARLEAQGVTVTGRPWGTWDVIDPEGNVFGITQAA